MCAESIDGRSSGMGAAKEPASSLSGSEHVQFHFFGLASVDGDDDLFGGL